MVTMTEKKGYVRYASGLADGPTAVQIWGPTLRYTRKELTEAPHLVSEPSVDTEGKMWPLYPVNGRNLETGRFDPPWILAFDLDDPEQEFWHKRFLEWRASPDSRGRLNHFTAYETPEEKREREIQQEVERRMALRAQTFGDVPTAPPEPEQPLASAVAAQDADSADEDDGEDDGEEVPPGSRKCPACGLVKKEQGYRGHLEFSADRGNLPQEHLAALAVYLREREARKTEQGE